MSNNTMTMEFMSAERLAEIRSLMSKCISTIESGFKLAHEDIDALLLGGAQMARALDTLTVSKVDAEALGHAARVESQRAMQLGIVGFAADEHVAVALFTLGRVFASRESHVWINDAPQEGWSKCTRCEMVRNYIADVAPCRGDLKSPLPGDGEVELARLKALLRHGAQTYEDARAECEKLRARVAELETEVRSLKTYDRSDIR